MGLSSEVNGTNDFLITNDTNGDVIGVLVKGKNQLGRLHTALQEEFSLESIVKITDIETVIGSGTSFTVIDEEEDTNFNIRLLNAFIY